MNNEKSKLSLILPIALAVIIIGGLVFTLSAKSSENSVSETSYQSKETVEPKEQTAQGEAKVEYDKEEFQFGTISMSKGKVKKSFKIKNIGESNLKISKMATSCMCTTAQLIVGEKKSPVVQMHDGQARWTEELKPGEEGLVETIFDPAAHGPQGVGEIMRVISFETNDPNNKTVELHFSANVVR